MSIDFQIPERLTGFAAETIEPGAIGRVIYAEALTSLDGAALTWRLEELHRCLFGRIPGLPPPSLIDTLLVILRPDLSATAYVNEITPRALVRAKGPVTAGQPVFADDVLEIAALDLGVPIPPDCAFVLVRSFGWRKSLLYDFDPLSEPGTHRQLNLDLLLAKQAFRLLRGRFEETNDEAIRPVSNKLKELAEGLARLKTLLENRCEEEAEFQGLLEHEPWILSGHYRTIHRHPRLDDLNIPNFVATRNYDGFLDVIELKQPFLRCFRADGGFSSDFNDAWNQAERYLGFVRRNRDYLRNEKNLSFENPRAILIMGYTLTDSELRAIREKETMNPAITVLTYDHVFALGEAMYKLSKAVLTPEDTG